MRSTNLLLLVLGAAMCADAAPKITVQGHRGARAVRPENTLTAFEYAISIGVDVLELDLGVTKDNVVVVSHDQLINRGICKGPEGESAIRKLTLAQVRRFDCGSTRNPEFPRQQLAPGSKIPTLDEVLALAPRGAFLYNIETKSDENRPELSPPPDEFARLVVEAVRRRKLERRVIIQSFDWRTLKAVKKIAPEIRLSALFASFPRSFVEIAKEAGGVHIVSPHYLLVTEGKVREAHDAGLEVVPWTPNSPGQWDRLIEDRVDSVITDDPAALIGHLKKKGLR